MHTKVYGLYSKSLEKMISVSSVVALEEMKQPLFFMGQEAQHLRYQRF